MKRMTKKQLEDFLKTTSQKAVSGIEEGMRPKKAEEINVRARDILAQKRIRRRIGFMEFLRRQIRFIYCRIWLVQACMLMFLCTFLEVPVHVLYMRDTGSMTRYTAFLLCCMSVLVLFLAVPFLYRSIHYTMHELELTTRFSSVRLLAARMLAIGAGNVILLLGLLIFTVIRTSLRIDSVLLYLLLPYLAAACGLLYLLRHLPADKLQFGSAGLACILLLTFVLLKRFWPAFFVQRFSFGWGIVCLVLFLFCTKQMHELLRRPMYAS